MMIKLTVPGRPSLIIQKSWPGILFRRVSQPSIHLPDDLNDDFDGHILMIRIIILINVDEDDDFLPTIHLFAWWSKWWLELSISLVLVRMMIFSQSSIHLPNILMIFNDDFDVVDEADDEDFFPKCPYISPVMVMMMMMMMIMTLLSKALFPNRRGGL